MPRTETLPNRPSPPHPGQSPNTRITSMGVAVVQSIAHPNVLAQGRPEGTEKRSFSGVPWSGGLALMAKLLDGRWLVCEHINVE